MRKLCMFSLVAASINFLLAMFNMAWHSAAGWLCCIIAIVIAVVNKK